MARMTTAAVGRVNTRFLLLALILAALSAVLVYAAVSRSGGGGSSAADLEVVVTTEAVAPGTTLADEMLTIKAVASDTVGEGYFSDIDQVSGKLVTHPLTAGEPVLSTNIAGGIETASNDVLSNILESGRRGLGITTSAVVNAGGLVLPGDHVDVFWVPEKPTDDVPGAQLVAENVEVVSVEQTLVEIPPSAPGLQQVGDETGGTTGTDRIRGSEADPLPAAITVTLMVTPQQAQRIFCGEMTGSLRLAVRAFGDDSPSGLAPVVCIIRGDAQNQQP